jgi:tRNA U55 pseudouridine synthase TruB
LGCGAVLAVLRRTYVGRFCVDSAAVLDELVKPEDVERSLLSMDDALDLPVVVVPRTERPAVASGAPLTAGQLIGKCPVEKGWVQIKLESGKLLALGQVRLGPLGLWIHPKRVLVK